MIASSIRSKKTVCTSWPNELPVQPADENARRDAGAEGDGPIRVGRKLQERFDDPLHQHDRQQHDRADKEGQRDRLPAEEGTGHHQEIGIADAEGLAAKAVFEEVFHGAADESAPPQPQRRR